ncbi:sugar transporter [Pseudovirgaria hyperparasitica]|uniref:Sugar transporter n=1 Tax=Pseudovirgaria hyperparasitica TaxID=470096 RepID=A0A6A6WAJ3_9PEZI|nr:sugar transporter [Pseudovirgaria hyperparasitica]KAF2758970.1 sugar transporter [Pseudovirgaria hyperparasitica]
MAIGNIYLISAIAVIGGGLFGFDISSMSAILPIQPYRCYFNQQGRDARGNCLGPRSDVQGGITASMAGGSWLGALVSGILTDKVGRKKAIMIGSIIWIIGSVISAASQNIAMLIVGRVINGFCVGICSAQVPVYISELCPPRLRGRLVGAQQWAITWGILIMFYISYGCSFLKGNAAFRIPWGLQAIPAVILLVGMLFLPESPRWLARKDRWEECKSVLVLVLGKGDPHSSLVAEEYAEIQAYCEFERQNADVSWMELFRPGMLNRTHIGVFTQIWSQLTGMNVMMYYITYVFTMAGLTGNNLLISSSIQYIINVLMTIPALLFVDRLGRRPVLLAGALLMATWQFANAGLLASYGHPAPPGGVDGIPEASWQIAGPPSKAVIACTYLFVASFAPTWGPVSWIYPPELFPLRVRGKAVALATSANWAFNFALGYFVPPAFVNIQWKTYLVFGVFCVAMFVHVFFLFPETAGKPLEEVEEMFLEGVPAWKTGVGLKGGHSGRAAAKLEKLGKVGGDGHGDGVESSPERLESAAVGKV